MDNIESSLTSLLQSLRTLCPNFSPLIVPQSFSRQWIQTKAEVDGVEQIHSCLDNLIYKSSQANIAGDSHVALISEIDYATRRVKIVKAMVVDSLSKKLNSLEDMMKVLIIGDDNDIQLLADRLIKLNEQVSASNYTGSKRQYLSEVYNLCYTIKVLISNVPGIQVSIDDIVLPPFPTEDFKIPSLSISILFKNRKNTTVKSISKTKSATEQREVQPRDDADSDEDHSDNDSVEDANKKKRKRKRGKG